MSATPDRSGQVVVEFFGVARARAGVAECQVAGGRFREVICELSDRFPAWAEQCAEPDRLRRGYIANLNGQRFLNDPDTLIQPGDHLLILSADVGG